MAKRLFHPPAEDIDLANVLAALGDESRLCIVRQLLNNTEISCAEATSFIKLPKATISYHFKILREAGIIRTEKLGVSYRNSVRAKELNKKFPGLLNTVMKSAKNL